MIDLKQLQEWLDWTKNSTDNDDVPTGLWDYLGSRSPGVTATRLEALRILDEAIEEMADASQV